MHVRFLAILVLAAVVGAPRAASAATNFNVTNNGMSSYNVDGASNPTLTLQRGQIYTFTINTPVDQPHPFWITTARGAGDVGTNAFPDGVTNNGASPGTVTFTVPTSAPATLFYQCGFHDTMGGRLNIAAAAVVPASGPAGIAALVGLLLVVAVGVLRRRQESRRA